VRSTSVGIFTVIDAIHPKCVLALALEDDAPISHTEAEAVLLIALEFAEVAHASPAEAVERIPECLELAFALPGAGRLAPMAPT
jgi:hypothetical protein